MCEPCDPEKFEFLKKTLQHFNYPNIHGYNDVEIADNILSERNRVYLITWALKLLGNEYEEILANKKNNPDFIADVLCESGFCTAAQKNGFVNGNLSVSEQTTILIRMFDFLMNVTNKEVSALAINSLTNEELSDFIGVDLNMFPSEGELYVYDEQAMKKQIFKLMNLIQETEKNVQNNFQHLDCSNIALTEYKDKIYDLLNSFRRALPEYKKNVLDCLEVKNVSTNYKIIPHPQHKKIIEECNAKMKKIIEVLSNIETFVEFSTTLENDKLNVNYRKKKEFDLIQTLFEKTSSVINIHQESCYNDQ